MTREDFLKNELKSCAKTIAFVIEHWKDYNDKSYNEFLASQLKICHTRIISNLNQLSRRDLNVLP